MVLGSNERVFIREKAIENSQTLVCKTWVSHKIPNYCGVFFFGGWGGSIFYFLFDIYLELQLEIDIT